MTGGCRLQGAWHGLRALRRGDAQASSQPSAIEVVDLNDDGRPEAFVTESSLFCYGGTEGLVVLLTKEANGTWRKLLDTPGMHLVRDAKHEGWRDVEIGGPGMGPHPIYRWKNGKYVESKYVESK